jgi:aminoglycoside 6'-N-acetyltransferase
MPIALRPMRVDDVPLVERWDDDPDVAASGGDSDWYDWPVELARDVAWREFLIVEDDDRPVGFVQLLDAVAEEEQYWGEVESAAWAIDIWIGSPADRGRGVGTASMRAALDRCFDVHAASVVLIDPLVTNERAIRFYRRLGFGSIGERWFGDDRCDVHRIDRQTWLDRR